MLWLQHQGFMAFLALLIKEHVYPFVCTILVVICLQDKMLVFGFFVYLWICCKFGQSIILNRALPLLVLSRGFELLAGLRLAWFALVPNLKDPAYMLAGFKSSLLVNCEGWAARILSRGLLGMQLPSWLMETQLRHVLWRCKGFGLQHI